MDAEWVHLRLCLECGHVGCCDDSPNTHATKHWKSEKHQLMTSFEPEETWIWCFECEEGWNPHEGDALYGQDLNYL